MRSFWLDFVLKKLWATIYSFSAILPEWISVTMRCYILQPEGSFLNELPVSGIKASLEPLQNLPALVELIFQCNALQQLSIVEGGFPKLEV